MATNMQSLKTPPPGDSRPDGPGSDNPHHTRRWAILGVLAIAQLMVVLDTTVVNIALPSAQRALHFSNTDRQWVVTAYALAFGSLLLFGGRLADLFGRKRLFLIGLVGFAVASAVGGAANSFGMLVIARAVQGVFGAMLAPAGLSLLTTTFTDAKERARAFGIYGAIAGGGAAIGLLLGGVLTEYLSWRWCMYVNLVFAATAFVGGMLWLRHGDVANKPRIDVLGALVVSAGLFSLVYGFSHAETAGWAATETLAFLIVGVALLLAFVLGQTRARNHNPLLPMRVLTDRNRGGAYIAIFVSGAGIFCIFLFLTYYLQASLGYSAVTTGIAFLPMTAAIIVVSTLSSTLLATRVGPRWIIAPGMLIAALGLVLLTGIDVASSYTVHVLPGTIIVGVGMGLIFSSAMSIATLGVTPQDAGVASAMVSTAQQVGGSISTALLNTLAASAAAAYIASHGPRASAVLAKAAVHGYTTAFWWSAAIFFVGALVCALLLRGKVPQVDPNAEAAVMI